jgi:uncharacterized RDD family membrane protein YckC
VARSPVVGPRVRGTSEVLASTGRSAERRARRRVESAADDVLSGPLPEAAVRSLVEHRLAERVAREAQAAVVREERTLDAGGGEAVDRLVEQVLASPAFERALGNVVEAVLTSPAVRAAISRQTATFGERLVDEARARAAELDDRVESGVRRRTRPPGPYAGVATRGAALVLDAALVNLVYLVGVGVLGLLGSFVTIRPEWLVAALGSAAWVVLVLGYFVVFWSAFGQTPGQRLLDVRVAAPGGGRPGVVRSAVRVIGLMLAIVPLLLGFAPALFDRRRRALPDYLAGTTVVYGSDAPSDAARTVDA